MPDPDSTAADPPKPMLIYDYNPYSLPADYLQAIGLVVAASAQTESILQDFIGVLLGIDNIETLALTTHMAAPLKDHVIRALIELNASKASIVDEVDDLLDRVGDAMAKRNTIVHNSFAIHPDTGAIESHRLKARGSLQLDLVPVTVEELQEHAALIYEAGLDLIAFMTKCGLAPNNRTRPIHEPLNRGKKARAERRQQFGSDY